MSNSFNFERFPVILSSAMKLCKLKRSIVKNICNPEHNLAVKIFIINKFPGVQ